MKGIFKRLYSNTIEKVAGAYTSDDRDYKEYFDEEIASVFRGIGTTIRKHLKYIYQQDPKVKGRINAVYLANKPQIKSLVDNARKDFKMGEQKINAIINIFK